MKQNLKAKERPVRPEDRDDLRLREDRVEMSLRRWETREGHPVKDWMLESSKVSTTDAETYCKCVMLIGRAAASVACLVRQQMAVKLISREWPMMPRLLTRMKAVDKLREGIHADEVEAELCDQFSMRNYCYSVRGESGDIHAFQAKRSPHDSS